jgi:hypothetical protein
MVVKLVKGEILESNLLKIPTQLVVRDSCASVKERIQDNPPGTHQEETRQAETLK